MAIADPVWERLTRFGGPRRNGQRRWPVQIAAVLRAFLLLSIALVIAFEALASLLGQAALWLGRHVLPLLTTAAGLARFRVLPACGRLANSAALFLSAWVLPAFGRLIVLTALSLWRRLPQLILTSRWIILPFAVAIAGWAAYNEMRASELEARLFSGLDRRMTFALKIGPSPSIRFPKSGPYDERLGYHKLPSFIAALTAHRYAIDRQARWSPDINRFVDHGGLPVYVEKDQAGLTIVDRNGHQTYGVRFPQRADPSFASIPPLIANSLVFIEDKYLFDPRYPEHNPAIEWKRFALAVAGRIARLVIPRFNEGGGSTLATQIEKFRHSPRGQTAGAIDKLRQMITASARAYINGPVTLRKRRTMLG